MLEVTLRTPRAMECILAIQEQVPGVVLGAGTVTSDEQVAMVAKAGLQFAVRCVVLIFVVRVCVVELIHPVWLQAAPGARNCLYSRPCAIGCL